MARLAKSFSTSSRCRARQWTLSCIIFWTTEVGPPIEKPGLAVLAAGTQPRHRSRLDWQRRPPGDAPRTLPRLRVVCDPREPSAQLDSSRQLSVLVKDSADRGSIGLGDNEHPNSMAIRTAAGKARYTAFTGDASGKRGADLCALLRPVGID
jgi:hypothetical protein